LLELAKEYLGRRVEVVVDRPLGSKHHKHDFVYETNYGFVKGVKPPDGEELDAYYLGSQEPLQKAMGVCVAIAHRKNDDDDKLIVAPENISLSDDQIMSSIRFQEKWFDTVIIRQ
jgi:inorganic pyrophosphatase